MHNVWGCTFPLPCESAFSALLSLLVCVCLCAMFVCLVCLLDSFVLLVCADKLASPTQHADDALVERFQRLLDDLAAAVSGVADLVISEHKTYGNLEFLARACRNIAFLIAWTTVDDTAIEKVQTPAICW
jgi:hypothetical protein